MIRVTKSDGTTSSLPARAVIVILNESGQPESVRIQNGQAEEQWPAREIANLEVDVDVSGSPFRLEIHRPLSQTPELWPQVTQLHFTHQHRRMAALHAGEIVYDLQW